MDTPKIDWRAEPGNEGEITRVDGTSISFGDCWGFGWPAEAGALPRVGDSLKLLSERSCEFYGIAINGVLIWYLTPAEREQRRIDSLARMKADREERFEKARDQLDADYTALPIPFQRRIGQLRVTGGDAWRAECEAYEMFVCKEAVKIAEQFGSRAEIARWNALGYEEQRAEWDGFDSGHSGNTFGMACSLAAMWCDADCSDRAEALVVAPQAIGPIAGDPRYVAGPR